jgi:hypothetical protein
MKIRTRFFLFLIPLFLVVCGSSAWAQGHDDLIVLSTAPDGTGSSSMEIAPFATGKICLCVRNGIDPLGVWAWECLLDIPTNMLVTQWDMTWGLFNPYGPLNIASPPEFIVGVGVNPIPPGEWVCIMTIYFVVTDANPGHIYIHPCSMPSIPDHPVYAGGTSPGALYALDWGCGSEQIPAFTVNGGSDLLMRDCRTISNSEGCVVDFHLDAGPGFANRLYFLAGSATGTSGINLPGGGVLPLTQDYVTNYILNNYNNSLLNDFQGQFDAQGRAKATLVKDGPFPIAAGRTLYFAYTTTNPFDLQSNPVSLMVLP